MNIQTKEPTIKDLRRYKSHAYVPYVMPTMILMALLAITPIIFVILISFTNYQLGTPFSDTKFIGLSNYIRLFDGTDSIFPYSVYISLFMMVAATSFQMVLGFINAMLLNQDFKFKGLALACLIVPIAMTPSIASQIWKLMYNSEFGVINYFVEMITGLQVVWLGKEFAILSVLIANIWMSTPFVTLILYAGLRTLPQEPFESAIIDGANRFELFYYVTLPLMKYLILLTLLLRSIDMMKMFDIPYVLTQGGPGSITQFLGLMIYDVGFGVSGMIGRASAISVILILIVSVMALFLINTMRKNRN